MHESSNFLTLGQAAALVPNHPSPNCIWRWCRKGVKARSGERVHLQHVRLGGVIYTTGAWMQEFGRQLVDADAKHFDLDEQDVEVAPHQPRATVLTGKSRQAHLQQVQRELTEAGL